MKAILKCFPNLVHMRLFDGNYETNDSSSNSIYQTDSSLFDGYEWERFIETQLSRLKQFEFYFSRFALSDEDYISTMRSLINPFRTPFWLENKHWIVKNDYEYDHNSLERYRDMRPTPGDVADYFYRIHLYSVPIFHDSFDYSKRKSQILNSMLNITNNNQPIIVHSSEVTLDGKTMIQSTQNKVDII
ncbi:unnamed protein product [Rotaria sp. Silwood2]|nr:unnamed protein product [Rotaria sp. Silwood2]CAF3904508.1 unnamed protein product [Rotaria sp. Silwood2]